MDEMKKENEMMEEAVEVETEAVEAETVEAEAIETESVEVEEVEKKSGLKASFQTLNFRGGIYAVAVSAVAIILVIIINMVAGKLNINVDLTATGLYTLDEDTIEYVSAIEDEIKLYYFVQSGTDYPEIDNVLERFDGLGKNMEVITVDPILHPNYASGLVGDEAAATLQFNSIIVMNETNGRSKLVLTTEMITSSIDYETYTEIYTSDVEGQIASALMYVTNEDLPVMYIMSGNGEVELTDTQKSLMSKNNVDMITYDALTGEAVPEDCDILYINYPSYDFTEAQVEIIKNYLSAGGKVIMNLDYIVADFKNLNSLLNYYGVEMVPGIIYETDSRYYAQNMPYCLIPEMADHAITEEIQGVKRLFVPQATGLRVLDNKRSTITATELLTTTAGAYSKVDLYSMGENKEEGDIDGPFAAGICVEETYHGNTAQLLVYTSYLWDDVVISEKSYGNRELLINSINYLSQMESTFYAPTQNLNQQIPSWNLTGAQFILHTALKVILLPLACLIIGGVIVILRRRSK